jgi:hypothetical protein
VQVITKNMIEFVKYSPIEPLGGFPPKSAIIKNRISTPNIILISQNINLGFFRLGNLVLNKNINTNIIINGIKIVISKVNISC